MSRGFLKGSPGARVLILDEEVTFTTAGGAATAGAKNLLARRIAERAAPSGRRSGSYRSRPRHVNLPLVGSLYRSLEASGGVLE